MEANNILNKNVSTLVNDVLLGAIDSGKCPADLICVRADTGACGTRDMADICPLDETCTDDTTLCDATPCNTFPCIDDPIQLLNYQIAKKMI